MLNLDYFKYVNFNLKSFMIRDNKYYLNNFKLNDYMF